MLNTNREVLRILESLCNLCTDNKVHEIIGRAVKEIQDNEIRNLPEMNKEEMDLAEMDKIKAIKMYRDRAETSIHNAKTVVDAYRSGRRYR